MLNLTDRNGVTILRLEHGKAHALDLELARALTERIGELDRDPAARALVLTGTGGIFSAGVDLHRLLAEGPSYAREFVPALADVLRQLFVFSRPAVAAINGHAIAGGCVLAAACDYRLMARGNATIGVPELRVGLPFPLVAVEILRFATSTAHLQELLYHGKTYRVDEASARGLVDEVVAPEALLERACEVAELFAAEPAARFRITKRQLRAPTLASIRHHAPDTEADVVAEWTRPESLAAIRTYLEGVRQRRG
jgi:enoyl-CoA hydratase